MNKALEKLRLVFTEIGEKKIKGTKALMLIEEVFYDLVIPDEIIFSQNYINSCHKDMGFLGSPKYYAHKKIVDDYFEPRKKIAEEKAEMEQYLKLKAKFEK